MRLEKNMFIERPPLIYRLLLPGAIWRFNIPDRKVVFLTFDDGPIPEVTPWVLDTLDEFGAKATFFMVGDNVRRNPHLLGEVVRRGHSVGNHTMHHIRGVKVKGSDYSEDVDSAYELIKTRLFRPPHGLMSPTQYSKIKNRFKIIMHDVVSCDYSAKLSPERVIDNVRRYTRNGSIIVFHDSLKAEKNLRHALPQVLKFLKNEGYEFASIPMD